MDFVRAGLPKKRAWAGAKKVNDQTPCFKKTLQNRYMQICPNWNIGMPLDNVM
jgi:uncharacterized protein YbbK (DUF523 family)